MKLKLIIGLIALFILSPLALAGDYQVDENLNLLGNDVHNATNVNTTNLYATELNTKIFNNIYYANEYSGDTAGEKITTCIANISGSGVCDARGLTGNQIINTSLNLTSPVVLLLGEAEYNLSAHIRISSDNVTIKGAGIDHTILKIAGSTAINAIEVNDPLSGGANASTIYDVHISDLTVDGNRDNQVDGGDDEYQEGIIITKLFRGYFYNLKAINFIYTGLSFNIHSEDIFVDNYISQNNGHSSTYGGLLISGTVKKVSVSNFVSYEDEIAVWLTNNANYNMVSVIARNGTHGVVIDNSDGNIISFVGYDGTGNGVTIQDGVSASSYNSVYGYIENYVDDISFTAADDTNKIVNGFETIAENFTLRNKSESISFEISETQMSLYNRNIYASDSTADNGNLFRLYTGGIGLRMGHDTGIGYVLDTINNSHFAIKHDNVESVRFESDGDINMVRGGNLEGIENMTSYGYILGKMQPLHGMVTKGVTYTSEYKLGLMNLTENGTHIIHPAFSTVFRGTNDTLIHCNIPAGSLEILDGSHNAIVNSSCDFKLITTIEFLTPTADRQRISTVNIFALYKEQSNGIKILQGEPQIGDVVNKIRYQNVYTRHLRILSGMDITTGTFPEIIQSAGRIVFDLETPSTTQQNSTSEGIYFTYHTDSVNFTSVNQSGLNLTHCDNGSELITCSDSKWRRYFIYNVGYYDGETDRTSMYQLAARDDITYTNRADCLNLVAYPLTYTLPTGHLFAGTVHSAYCARPSHSSWLGSLIDFDAELAIDVSHFLTDEGEVPLAADWDVGNYTITAGGFNRSTQAVLIPESEHYRGSNCSGSDGAASRILTLSNTRLTVDDGLGIYINGLFLHIADYSISHYSSGTNITLTNNVWDADYMSVTYFT